MDKRSLQRVGTVFTILGAAITVCAAVLYVYLYFDDLRAGRSADFAVEQISAHVVETPQELTADPAGSPAAGPAGDPAAETADPTFAVDGVEYLGYISFTGYEKKLPVIADWDFESLETAPVRYVGSFADDNIVIAGHNYRSHFYLLHSLVVGNEIVFTDPVGNETHYLVAETETLRPTDIAEMCSGGWDMTLFTCTTGGRARFAVRCEKKTFYPADEAWRQG